MSLTINTNQNASSSPVNRVDDLNSNKKSSSDLSRISHCCDQNSKIRYSMQQLLLMMNNITKDDASKEIDKKVKQEVSSRLKVF